MEKQQLKTIVGAVIIKMATGIVTCFGTTNLYFLSYFHETGEQVNRTTNSILLLAIVVPMSLFILAAPKLADLLGHERMIKICAGVFFLSPFLLHYKFNLFILTIFCFLIPTAFFAISTIPTFYCIWTHFPQSRNKATSVAVVCFALGGIFWNYLFMVLVNPQNLSPAIVDEKVGMVFFGHEVTQNLEYAVFVGYFISGAMFVMGSLLITVNKNYQEEKPEVMIELMERNKKQAETREPTFRQTLLSKKFICLFLISFMSGLFQIYVNVNVKLIYIQTIQDDHFLGYCVMIGTIISTGGSFIWGYLGDKRGFHESLLLFTLLDCLIKIYSCFAETKMLVLIMFVLLGITDKGMLILMGPGLVSLFGIKMATQLLPYKGISIYLGYAFAPLLYLVFSYVVSPHDYLKILWVFSVITCILAYLFYHRKI